VSDVAPYRTVQELEVRIVVCLQQCMDLDTGCGKAVHQADHDPSDTRRTGAKPGDQDSFPDGSTGHEVSSGARDTKERLFEAGLCRRAAEKKGETKRSCSGRVR
jgi:hypothetical protein